MTDCTQRFLFGQVQRRQIVADFRGGQITSDAGLLPLAKIEAKLGYCEKISRILHDPRNPFLITHEQVELVRQRLLGIIAGYEDCNDATHLRHDPLFKLLAGKKDLLEPLGSQPTLCRLEQRATQDEIDQLNEFLTDFFIEEHRHNPPREILLDPDSTDDECHGHQQLALFNGYYDQYMYLPLLIYEGHSGYLLGVRLRDGTAHNTQGLTPMLQRIVGKIRSAWPNTRIVFRADAGFADPILYEYLEQESIKYAIGIGCNDVLERLAGALLQRARQEYAFCSEPIRLFGSFQYQAQSWTMPRRICIKVEVNSQGENKRFLVVTQRGEASEVFEFYNGRGECENRIEELKNDLAMDRLSCETFRANQFRLMLHALAYNLVAALRRRLEGTALETATTATLRVKLFKLGALVQQTTRKIWIHMSSSWPFRENFAIACAAAGP